MRQFKAARTLKAYIVLFAAVTFWASAPRETKAQSFQTAAPTAILMDANSHAVLFEKNADERTAPASMAKIMAAEVVFN